MTYQGHADALRETADALEDAQRALNHLDALVDSWDESSEDERIETVLSARSRLNGTWNGLPSRALVP